MRTTFRLESIIHILMRPLLLAVALCSSASLHATTNYFLDFESFTPGLPVVGADNWDGFIADLAGNGADVGTEGNGVVTGEIAGLGNQGFVGRTTLPSGYCYLDMWRTNGAVTNASTMTFSVTMNIVDSTINAWDIFSWQAWTTGGERLWSLRFDNRLVSSNIYYASGTNTYIRTTKGFVNGQVYNLIVAMDMVSNMWSATLNGTLLFAPTPMTAPSVVRDLDSVDAVWDARYWYYNYGYYGDNYMLFDNYLITSQPLAPPPPSRPTLSILSASSGNPTTLRLTGQEGYKFAIDTTTNLATPVIWSPLVTNTVTGGFFDSVHSGTPALPGCNYRARWVP